MLTNGFISFSIELNSGCSEDAEGDRDDTYDEATDTSLSPVISLVGSSTIYLGVGDTFTDAGATAEDSIDGDITSSITSSGTVDTSTAGTYTIEYSVSDTAGNSVSITRTVVVSLDLPPTITLTGSSTITLLVGDTYIEDGCVATDQEDGDITASITTSGTVDVSNTGTYTLVYSVSDSGNNFVSVTRTVIVDPLPDTTPPTITLTGSSTINLTVGDTFTDPGATATDNVDGDLTSSITTSGSVNTSTAGTYTIAYSVSDAAGNTASVNRTIEVVETQFTATIIAGNGGTVSTPGGTVNEGTVLSITATPNDGYEFIGWEGNDSNEVSITVNSDLTLTANFQLIEVATNYYSSGELVANNNISEWFDRSLDVYGIRLLVAGNAGGQIAVPDEWAKKVAQTFKLLIDKDAAGINPVAQEKMIKILLGEEGTASRTSSWSKNWLWWR